MGLEATSWDWLRDGIMKRVPNFALLDRVENGVLYGMADVNYLIRGVEGWIELKSVALPTRDSTPVLGDKGLRDPDQINWHLKRSRMLGRTFVFVTAMPFRWLVGGEHAKTINSWTRDDFCVHARMWYDENWKDRQWNELVSALVGPGWHPK